MKPIPIRRKDIAFAALFTLVSGGDPSGILTTAAIADTTTFETWARTARVAGASVWTGMTNAEIDRVVNSMAAQNVSVIEADSNLSNYMTDAEFDQELALMGQFAAAAHAKGIKVGWYYPTFEVLTPNGANIAETMGKQHPDWVQRGLDGTPNMFYGGLVFWVEPGMESAWMSPSSPGYRNYYLNRVKKIAAKGLDFLWGDVPLLYDVGTQWADTNSSSTIKFNSDTGLTTPATLNWNDPTWRRWIAWRHEEVADFLRAVGDAGRSVDPNFKFIVETVTMDYASGTKIGLDGSYLKGLPGITHVWELDPVSNANAMRQAREDDWIRMIAMNKFARGASGDKPAWVFDYGKQANDAELVMAETLAARNNPYESKIPIMATTVGAAYRTRMFGWVKANESYLYDARKAARIAVLYSSENRDFVDRASGEAMYATTTSSDAEFWSTDPAASVYRRQYLAEYNGMVKLLVHNHVPFEVIVKPTAAELASYQTVILPDIEAISDADAALLRAYTTAGGHLIVTGSNPTGWDQYGTARNEFALADVLGLSKTAALPGSKVNTYGSGESRFFSALLGKSYLTSASDAAAAATTLLGAINATTTPWLTTNANKKVHFELHQADNRLMLHHVNFIGVTGTFAVTPTSATTTLTIPAGKEATAVELTSPDNATPALSPLSFTKSGQNVTFTVPVTEYALAVVSLKDAGSAVNVPPVAANDSYNTTNDKDLVIAAPGLLSNDSDGNGDVLTVVANTQPASGGTVTVNANGGFTFKPTAGFVGTATFTYTVGDGKGGTASGTVTITVSAPTGNTPPTAANDSYSTTKDTPLSVAAPGLLANDSDADRDPLTVVATTQPSSGGTVTVNPNGSFTFAPATGFVGTATFNYTAGDGKGGTASATATINVAAGATPQTLYPSALTVTTGTFNSGGIASLTASDGNTYDVKSAFVATESGGVTDWYGRATISGSVSATTQVKATYSGQYSKTGVTQRVYLYNFVTSIWDQMDSRTVGNTDDVTVTVTPADPRPYVSASGEIRLRVRGFRSGVQTTTNWSFLCWANLLKWEVK